MNSLMNPSMHASSSGSSNRKQQFRTNYSSSSNHNGRPRPFCDHCRKPGHTKDKCFKIHGYPQTNAHNNGQNHNGYSNQNRYNNVSNQNSHNNSNYNQFNRSAKGKGIAANAFGIDTEHNNRDTAGPSNNPSPNLTKDQYSQLLSMLQQFQINNAEGTNEDQTTNGLVNFAVCIQESHPPFDIAEYGAQVLSKLSLEGNSTHLMSFSDVIMGQMKHGVGRTFSALLQLINNGDVDLERGATNEFTCYTAVNPFYVKLLRHDNRADVQLQTPKDGANSSISNRDIRKRKKKGKENHAPGGSPASACRFSVKVSGSRKARKVGSPE